MIKKTFIFLLLIISFSIAFVSLNLLLMGKEVLNILIKNISFSALIIIFIVSLIIFIFTIKYFLVKFNNGEKGGLITFGFFLLIQLVGYFYYYADNTKYEEIDKDYFKTEFGKIEVKDEDNSFIKLENFILKVNELLPNETLNFSNQYSCIVSTDSHNCKYEELEKIKNTNYFDKEIINKIDTLNQELEKIIESKFIWSKKYNIDGITDYGRNSFYNILFYFENNQNDKGLNIMLNNYKLSVKFTKSDGPILLYIIGITIKDITLKQLNYIIGKYNLSNSELLSIKNELSKNTYLVEDYNNKIKNECNFVLKGVEENFKNTYPNIFFNKNKISKGIQLKYKRAIEDGVYERYDGKYKNLNEFLIKIASPPFEGYKEDSIKIYEENDKLLKKVESMLEVSNNNENTKDKNSNSTVRSSLLKKFKNK